MNNNNNNWDSSGIALWALIIFLFLILLCFGVYWGRTMMVQRRVNQEYFDNVEHMKSYMENNESKEEDEGDDNVTRMDVPSLVMFMAPWCGHCQRMKPNFERLMSLKRENPNMKIVMFDCDKRKDLARQHSIQGFQTVRLYPRGMINRDNYVEYEGNRSTEDLVRFLNDNTN